MNAFCALLASFYVLLLPSTSSGGELLLREGALVNFAPPVINKDYYLFEYGFVVKKDLKKWNYQYNAFVNASLWEDWKNQTDNLRAGALGFKAGVLFPIFPRPLFYRVAGGFAKSVLHKNPVFGKEGQSVSKNSLFLFEAGFMYKFDQTFFNATYQVMNVNLFKRQIILSFGVNY